MYDQEVEDDGLGCARGIIWSILLGALLWAAVVGSIVLVRGYHEHTTVEFGCSQAVEVPVVQVLSRVTVTESSKVH